ncbi:hypothetical protein KAR91_39410 [Candidatus Pacearchaeota archaeon]|nr:hypothetical protein [Candidatus Pacearchaeota archaeon]
MEEFGWQFFSIMLFFVAVIVLVMLFANDAVNGKDTIVFSQKDHLMRSMNEKLTLLTVDTAGMAASLASIDKSLNKIAFDGPGAKNEQR